MADKILTKEEVVTVVLAEINRVNKLLKSQNMTLSTSIAYTQYNNGLRFVLSLVEKM